jgi:arylsulfatase A-like enzyme
LLAKLNELDLDESTIVIFFSDNGGIALHGVRGPRGDQVRCATEWCVFFVGRGR